ncbi:hypothetical protein [Ferruginibacter sp.]
MPDLSTAAFAAKINWSSPKANHKQKVLKFTDADLYSEESETAAALKKPKVRFIKRKEEGNKIF